MTELTLRIGQPVFTGTTVAFFILCIIASSARFYIRFRIQREAGWDDAFLAFGLCCLTGGIVLLWLIVDLMYMLEKLLAGIPVSVPGDIMIQSLHFKKMNAAGLTLMWFSVCCVKYSFLALFKRLIRQMPRMIRYWWVAVMFNTLLVPYGAAVYWISCPYFREDQAYLAVHCATGSMLAKTLSYCISQMVLDVVGDILILIIPIYLIWRIRTRWTQKVMLAFSLCLTVVTITITVARAVGIKWYGTLDAVWETYFMVLSAEVGLCLAAIAAFRAFFVARVKERQVARQHPDNKQWYSSGRLALRNFVTRLTRWSSSSGTSRENMNLHQKGDKEAIWNNFPSATMTGLRTFISKAGRTTVDSSSDPEHIATLVEEDDAFWPHSDRVHSHSTVAT